MDSATWWSNTQPIDLCETRVERFGDWLRGPRQNAVNGSGTTPTCSAVEWAALMALGVHGLRDLAVVIEAWDRLPETVRAGMVASVQVTRAIEEPDKKRHGSAR